MEYRSSQNIFILRNCSYSHHISDGHLISDSVVFRKWGQHCCGGQLLSSGKLDVEAAVLLSPQCMCFCQFWCNIFAYKTEVSKQCLSFNLHIVYIQDLPSDQFLCSGRLDVEAAALLCPQCMCFCKVSYNILETIREFYPEQRLYALNCIHYNMHIVSFHRFRKLQFPVMPQRLDQYWVVYFPILNMVATFNIRNY
jgi:hypothetical protein